MLQIHVFPQSISSKYLFDSDTCQLSRLQSNKMNFNTCQFVGVLEARLQSTIYMKTECSRSIQFNWTTGPQNNDTSCSVWYLWGRLVEINLSIHLSRRDYLNGITFNGVVKAQKLATICVNKPFKVCICRELVSDYQNCCTFWMKGFCECSYSRRYAPKIEWRSLLWPQSEFGPIRCEHFGHMTSRNVISRCLLQPYKVTSPKIFFRNSTSWDFRFAL